LGSIPLQLGDLGYAPAVAAFFELGLEKSVHQEHGRGWIDSPRSECKDVHVIVTTHLPYLFFRRAEPRSDAGDLVGRDLHAHTAAAHKHAAIRGAVRNIASDGCGENRIVARQLGSRASISHGVSFGDEFPAQALFEEKSGVVGANRNSHGEV
jgi:hypothetical protein